MFKRKVEVWYEDRDSGMEEYAVWSTAYVNKLPDSAFLYKDSNGRHLPFKDANGKIDKAHLANAKARVNQITGISAETVNRIKAKIDRLMGNTQKTHDESLLYSTEQFSAETDDEGLIWVHGFPYKTYKHPRYGEITFSPKDAEEMVHNFTANVLGRDVAWNYDHGEDGAKGNKAAGWVRKLDVRDDGLYVGVEPTVEAMHEISDGAWKYSSIERRREWENPETLEVHKNVLVGGAFTNTPFMYGIAPLNFSEYLVDEQEGNEQEDEVNLEELAKSVGLGADASEDEVFSRIKAIKDDAEKYKDGQTTGPNSGVERFKDTEPELYAEIMEGRKQRQETKAEKFADGMKTEDGKVLAPAHREKVVDAHLKLQRQEIPVEEFSAVVAEAASKGFVRLGTEHGGASVKDTGDVDVNKQVQEFSDKARKLAKDEKIDLREAYHRLAADEPELYEAYKEFKSPQLIEV